MVINLLEKQPVIVLNQAKSLGHLNGLKIKGDMVYAFLCSNDAEISPSDIIQGPDAFVVQKFAMVNLPSHTGQVIRGEMPVYTTEGQLTGKVSAVFVSDSFKINGVYAGDTYIPLQYITAIGDIIVTRENVQSEANDGIEPLEPPQSAMQESTSQQEASFSHDASIPSLDTGDMLNSRYRYLLGKKLLSSLTIGSVLYEEGHRIDEELIDTSIKNNCILNIIMNAED